MTINDPNNDKTSFDHINYHLLELLVANKISFETFRLIVSCGTGLILAILLAKNLKLLKEEIKLGKLVQRSKILLKEINLRNVTKIISLHTLKDLTLNTLKETTKIILMNKKSIFLVSSNIIMLKLSGNIIKQILELDQTDFMLKFLGKKALKLIGTKHLFEEIARLPLKYLNFIYYILNSFIYCFYRGIIRLVYGLTHRRSFVRYRCAALLH